MCGIAGISSLIVPKPVDPARVEAMADVLAHRGPDGAASGPAPGAGLGHRELLLAGGARSFGLDLNVDLAQVLQRLDAQGVGKGVTRGEGG